MGNEQSNPVGTDFKQASKDRKKYHNVDIPDIPLNKLREVGAEVDQAVKGSKYIVFYKKEVKEALKRKRAKGHEPKLFRLHDKCLHPADEMAGKTNDRKALMQRLVDDVTPVVQEDFILAYKDEGMEGDKEILVAANKTIYRLIHERVHELLHETTEKVYKRYLKGEDYNESGDESDDNDEKEAARQARAADAARQREYEAECWLAELTGEEPPEAPEEEPEEEYEEYEEEEEVEEVAEDEE